MVGRDQQNLQTRAMGSSRRVSSPTKARRLVAPAYPMTWQAYGCERTTAVLSTAAGTGIVAMFGEASAALGAGVAIQQAADQAGRDRGSEVRARVGLSLGAAALEDGAVRGVAVVEAARLCAAAAVDAGFRR
jgi:class 3 adenylate cyclase